MSSFKGSEIYSIDSKGRVKIPARMLRSLSSEASETFMLNMGRNGCIYAYPKDEWEEIERKLKSLNQFAEKDIFFLRRYLMDITEVQLDGQQRLSIPQKYLEPAKISNEVEILGVLDHLEFWNPQKLKDYIASRDEKEFDEISEEVMTRK
ncbi:MAG: division/cell wall cluster transcriptional repressor MraZ [Chloroherpetonaceae bacterium]|nr:division/cell wall cluster transcriptional repressor MraZ [bacterium]HAW08511.1 division/cell wall cluster transcriptional repressor MraZ [Bacteroidota bacterium]